MDEREELARLRRLRELEEKATGQPASVTLGATLRDIPRQVGLTARYGMEAFGQTALPDLMGLPSPQNPNERVIGDASRTAIGAMGLAKGAGYASQLIDKASRPVAAGIARVMGENLGPQLTGAMGAGVAGGAVREAGGGPTEQFIASVVGGLGGGLAYGPAAASVRAGTTAARKIVSPRDIQGEVSVALERTGIKWDDLSRQAQAQLIKDAESALYKGEALDTAALGRLAHYRNIGATPTRGQITQDPGQITLERNLAKSQANMRFPVGTNLSNLENQNTRTVLSTLENVEKSPADAYAAGGAVQKVIGQTDDALRTAERSLYQQARDAAGRDIELDREGFVYGAYDTLARENKGAFLPKEIQTILESILSGKQTVRGKEVAVPFTVDTIDNLKTTLATAQRGAQDGNVKRALGIVRESLENTQPRAVGRQTGSTMPVAPEVLRAAQGRADSMSADALGKFDAARAAARNRFAWQESAPFIEDALSGMAPEQFTKRHILNGSYDDLVKLRKEIGSDFATVAATRKQLLDYIMQRGRADSDTVKLTSAGMEAGFKQIGRRKLGLFFSADEIQSIESAIKVAKYSQSQPSGSAVNNSNSGAMIVGRVMDMILGASNSTPFLGPMVTAPITGARVGLQARSAANVPGALTAPSEAQPTMPINALLALALMPRSEQ